MVEVGDFGGEAEESGFEEDSEVEVSGFKESEVGGAEICRGE